MTTHFLDEEANRPEAIVWHMVCGQTCIALDNGDLIPKLDFVGLADYPTDPRVDCRACKKLQMDTLFHLLLAETG